jgi:hypothetical protein
VSSLVVHSEPQACSRAGCHFFLSYDEKVPRNNGALLNIAHIIKHVMSLATEAELAALYIMACKAVYIRIIPEEMGHKKQPPTPIQTDIAMADSVINAKCNQNALKPRTCDSFGYATENANNNLNSTGVLAKQTMRIIGQNTIPFCNSPSQYSQRILNPLHCS